MKVSDIEYIMSHYMRSFILLNQFDSNALPNGNLNTNITYEIKYSEAKEAINELKRQLILKKEATDLFGNEKDNSFEGTLQSVIQTWGGEYLYPTIEEQAAHLLYFIIKNHAFSDGNKRIGAFLFVWFLEKNKHLFKKSGELKINDNALTALSLLVAQSNPSDKDLMVSLICNLIMDSDDSKLFESGGAIDTKEVIVAPAENITSTIESLSEKVEKRLRLAQTKKEFKDTEGRIGGSKKEKMAYRMVQMSDLENIEQDEALAIELVKKDKVYPKVNVTAELDKGVSSGTCFLKVKLRESVASAPANDVLVRNVYVGFIAYLVNLFDDAYNIEEFIKKTQIVYRNSLKELLRVLYPDIISGMDEKQASDKIKIEELRKKIEEVEPGTDVTDILDETRHQIKLIEQAQDQQSKSLIQEFIKSLGKDIPSYYSAETLGFFLLKDIFGVRFTNFIGRSKAYDTYDEAEGYEALTKEQSETLIKNTGSNTKEWIAKHEALLLVLDTLKTKEQFDEFFKKNGSYGFPSGWKQFAKFEKPRGGYFYYKDCTTPELIEAYKDAWISSIESEIEKQKEQLKAIQHKYREREADWSWNTDKGSGERKKKAELKANTYPPLAYIKRTGGYKITDADVTVESIRKKFGFKEVEFGQSLKDTEAREHIRHFLGAMADLGDILNMDIIQLNKLGGLSIAFASRGGGKASAHYEPLRKVINITKTSGGGAVAHEFAHYLDNILPLIDGFKSGYLNWASLDTPTSNQTVENHYVFNAFRDIFTYIYKRLKNDEISNKETQQEVKVFINASERSFGIPTINTGETIEEYFKRFCYRYAHYKWYDNLKKKDYDILGYIVHKFGYKTYELTFLSQKSRYYSYSKAMPSDYWSRKWELFARAFEVYISDKLTRAGRANNYLVSGVYFDRGESVYPQGEEREVLFGLYDTLMHTIKQQYEIADFRPWTSERVDEYVTLAEEKTEDGIIVDSDTGVVIEELSGKSSELKVESREKVEAKFKEFIRLLNIDQMEKGGLVASDILKVINNRMVNKKHYLDNLY